MCGQNELEVCTMFSVGIIYILVHSVLCQCIHTSTHTHTRILIPFEDSELTGLKGDIADHLKKPP